MQPLYSNLVDGALVSVPVRGVSCNMVCKCLKIDIITVSVPVRGVSCNTQKKS